MCFNVLTTSAVPHSSILRMATKTDSCEWAYIHRMDFIWNKLINIINCTSTIDSESEADIDLYIISTDDSKELYLKNLEMDNNEIVATNMDLRELVYVLELCSYNLKGLEGNLDKLSGYVNVNISWY